MEIISKTTKHYSTVLASQKKILISNTNIGKGYGYGETPGNNWLGDVF